MLVGFGVFGLSAGTVAWSADLSRGSGVFVCVAADYGAVKMLELNGAFASSLLLNVRGTGGRGGAGDWASREWLRVMAERPISESPGHTPSCKITQELMPAHTQRMNISRFARWDNPTNHSQEVQKRI